jgi:hypothetical protein
MRFSNDTLYEGWNTLVETLVQALIESPVENLVAILVETPIKEREFVNKYNKCQILVN